MDIRSYFRSLGLGVVVSPSTGSTTKPAGQLYMYSFEALFRVETPTVER